MSQDVDLWLAYEDVDFEKLCKFVAGKPIIYGDKHHIGWEISGGVGISLYKRQNFTYKRFSQYDKSNYWSTYVIIDCQLNAYLHVIRLIGLTIAKHVASELKGEAFLTDGECSLYYGTEEIVLTSNWLRNYSFPLTSTQRFEGFAFSQYGKLQNISHVFNESSDIVIHLLDDFIDDKWLNYFRNDDHPQKDTLPKPNQYIRYSLPVATSLLTIQKNAWQYGSYFQDEYPIALHYRIPDTWRDVMILQILLDCSSGAFYTYGIEDIAYNTKQLIVSTGDGEIIFLFKQNEFVINSKWQEYFSKFPIGVDDYSIDDTL